MHTRSFYSDYCELVALCCGLHRQVADRAFPPKKKLRRTLQNNSCFMYVPCGDAKEVILNCRSFNKWITLINHKSTNVTYCCVIVGYYPYLLQAIMQTSVKTALNTQYLNVTPLPRACGFVFVLFLQAQQWTVKFKFQANINNAS